MENETASVLQPARPSWTAFVELLKPITWFPPMWAFACGLVASGQPLYERWLLILAGIALAGPLICGTSQAVNDWFDRHVDALNEPNRPIPSGRVPGRQGLYFAIFWTALSTLVAISLGPWVAMAGVLGLTFAWAYSAPPLRLKQNGWFGNAAVGLCYEGLPWFTAAAVAAGQLPSEHTLWLALLYSLGAHGIMTLNDFKSIEGDLKMGVRSLPAQLGAPTAAKLACVVMVMPQIVVVGLLLVWGQALAALVVGAMLVAQIFLMARLLRDPLKLAPWYNATGVSLYVLGMMVSAIAIRGLVAG
ncbi:MAG TPA: chlorophyll synthase ChlG [Xanthomonadales bacterium]|nr:chlorophyll synthase ChlG [Xanthomonadales bacterium]